MGVLCPCSVVVDASILNKNVKFEGQQGNIRGNLFYLADVCTSTLAASTLSLEFEDTETPTGENDFTFVANEITSIRCRREGQNCRITVRGTGTINGGTEEFQFRAVFRDVVGQAAIDQVQSFVITDFFNQGGSSNVSQGTVVSGGCFN